MKSKHRLKWIAVMVMLMPTLGMAWQSDGEVLLRSYIHFNLAREVHAQATALAQTTHRADAEQVLDIASEWMDEEVKTVRKGLDVQFGDAARTRFEEFIGDYTTAENNRDPVYLEYLSANIRLVEIPPDYESLRSLALDRWLSRPMASGTRMLSEMQTWVDVREKTPDAPALTDWLERNIRIKPPAPPPRPVNPLAAAEASAPAWEDVTPPADSALDSFARRRREKREQATQAAQAGMQQMAMERQAAEQEYAAKKLAEAQAEAEAMRAQAQKMAAVEAEALAQRENSWGNRIKRILGGTVSAGVGAFTGGIGAEAGRRAADEMFR